MSGPGPGGTGDGGPQVLERAVTRRGELVLRKSGAEFEIISNGVFLMDTRDGRSERLMVTAALGRCRAAAPEILICGLGVGFALAEAVSQARVARVDVAEISAEIIGWHATHLRHLAAPAWGDGRIRVIKTDVVAWLARQRGPYDVICLDVATGRNGRSGTRTRPSTTTAACAASGTASARAACSRCGARQRRRPSRSACCTISAASTRTGCR